MSWVPDGENPFGDSSQHGNQSSTVPLVSSSAASVHSSETPPWLLESSQQHAPAKVTMQLPNPVPTPVSMVNNSDIHNMNVMNSGNNGGMEASQDR